MKNWGALALICVAAAAIWLMTRSTTRPQEPEPRQAGLASNTGAAHQAASEVEVTTPITVPESREHERTEISTRRSVIVRGRAVDADGRSMAGCVVELGGRGSDQLRLDAYLREHGDVVWESPPGQTTMEDGRFEFEFDPPPPYEFWLGVSRDGFVAMTGRWSSLRQNHIEDVGDVTMIVGIDVDGRVVDRNGAPQEGVEVLLESEPIGSADRRAMARREPQPVTSRADGRFKVPAVGPGEWLIHLGGRQLESRPNLVLRPEQVDATLDIVVTPLSEIVTVEGIVVDQLGNPVIGATIDVSPRADGPDWVYPTDRDGHFRVERRPQDSEQPITVRARRYGYELAAAATAVEWGTHDVHLVLAEGRAVDVRVTDEATGKPIENFGVRARPKPGSMPMRNVRELWVRNRGRHPDGVTTITGLRRGIYQLSVETIGNEWVQERCVEVEITDTTTPRVDVPLTRPTERTVRLVDADGKPIEGARVQLLEPLGGLELTLTTFANPPDGSASTSMKDQARTIVDTHTNAAGEVELRAHGRLACGLRVLGPGAVPLVKAAVRLVDLPEPWVVECERGATVAVQVGPPVLLDQIWREAGVDPATIDAQRDRTFTPKVFLQQERTRFPPGFDAEVALDPKGSARLEGVPPGDWELMLLIRRADLSGDRLHVATILDLREGETRVLDLTLDQLVRGTLRGRVLVDGTPHVGKALLRGHHGVSTDGRVDRSNATVECDERGEFEFSGRPGEWRLDVPSVDDAFHARSVASLVSEQTVDATFEIRTGIANVRLVHADGTAAAKLNSQWNPDGFDADSQTLTADGDGRVRKRLTSGTYRVHVVPKHLSTQEARQAFWKLHGRDGTIKWQRALVFIGSVVVDGASPETAQLLVPMSAGY